MNDGWYRLTHAKFKTRVEFVERNQCISGHIVGLSKAHWSFEEVTVLSSQELQQRIEEETVEAIRRVVAGLSFSDISLEERLQEIS